MKSFQVMEEDHRRLNNVESGSAAVPLQQPKPSRPYSTSLPGEYGSNGTSAMAGLEWDGKSPGPDPLAPLDLSIKADPNADVIGYQRTCTQAKDREWPSHHAAVTVAQRASRSATELESAGKKVNMLAHSLRSHAALATH